MFGLFLEDNNFPERFIAAAEHVKLQDVKFDSGSLCFMVKWVDCGPCVDLVLLPQIEGKDNHQLWVELRPVVSDDADDILLKLKNTMPRELNFPCKQVLFIERYAGLLPVSKLRKFFAAADIEVVLRDDIEGEMYKNLETFDQPVLELVKQ